MILQSLIEEIYVAVKSLSEIIFNAIDLIKRNRRTLKKVFDFSLSIRRLIIKNTCIISNYS